MERVYYLNHNEYQYGDTLKAWNFVKSLVSKNQNIRTITFLVESSHQFVFLEELGLSQIPNATYNVRNKLGLIIQVRTLKTYRPDYLSFGTKANELLVPIALSPEQLYPYEDKSNIAICVVVPWQLDEFLGFLSIHRAIDIETNISMNKPNDVDFRVLNAIEWLKNTSYPNEGYHHPNDIERLRQIAKALKQKKIPMNYESVVYACMQKGIIVSSARETADYFVGNKSIRLRDPFDKVWMNKVIDGNLGK